MKHLVENENISIIEAAGILLKQETTEPIFLWVKILKSHRDTHLCVCVCVCL